MTIQKQPLASTSTASTTRLRGLAAATVLTPLLALGACSTEAPVTANPTRAAAATTTGPTGTSAGAPASTATPDGTSGATTTTPAPTVTKTRVKVNIKDPILGHEISVIEVKRNLPWPKGNPVGQEAFELVGVRLKLQAGERFSAPLSPTQVTLRLGDTSVKHTTEFGSTFGTPVKWVARGQSQTGWLVFKIEHDVHPLVMQYHRPPYEVSTTDKAIKATVIQRKILD